MSDRIAVVDLFAGPGGLAEGFSSYRWGQDRQFKVVLSVEKEASAFRTLRLRSFFRQFEGAAPDSYYDYIAGRVGLDVLKQLHPEEWRQATAETHLLELGAAGTNEVLDPALDGIRKDAAGLSVLVGGPPCQAYSLVGRARNKGIAGYSASEDHRHFLYREYIRILERLHPAVFVMENVKGILSSAVDGSPIFDQVLRDLQAAGGAADSYRLVRLAPGLSQSGFVLKSERYGIPQTRHRVIVVGVRADIADGIANFDFCLEPSGSEPTVASVLKGMPALRSGLSRGIDTADRWAAVAAHEVEAAALQCARLGGASGEISPVLDEIARDIERDGPGMDRASVRVTSPLDNRLASWLVDNRLDHLPNNEARGHMPADLGRYAFVAAFAEKWHRSPRAHEFPPDLAPAHGNWHSGKFVDRFRAQRWGAPSSTVTSHISKDGHYFIHPDPTQCRSLTVREAARLQTFPDNYFFEGNRTSQFVQVGNAVPPLLAHQIAGVVARILDAAEAGETKEQLSHPSSSKVMDRTTAA